MRHTREFLTLCAIVASCFLLAGPAQMLGQQTNNDQSSLTLKQVKQRLKQNKQHLNEAAKRGKAGDAAGLQTALNNYSRGMQGLNTALAQGRIQGTPAQQEDAYNRVKKATQKHIDVLQGLLNNPKIPAQGKAGISKALAASQNGQQTALSRLSSLQAQHQSLGQENRSGFGQGGGMGESQGGMQHGPGSGANPGMGGGMGAEMGGGMGHGGGPRH